jgi:hypothetical protein
MVLRSARKSIQWIDFSEEGHGSGLAQSAEPAFTA